MHAPTALITALALFVGYLPATTAIAAEPTPPRASNDTQRTEHGAYVDASGRHIEYELWFEGGELQGDLSIEEPNNEDSLFMWIEGDTFVFEGVVDGEPLAGSEAIDKFHDPADASLICAGWVALLCLGALVVLSTESGCALWENCSPNPGTTVPGEQGGAGEGENGNESTGGGGDGEEDE